MSRPAQCQLLVRRCQLGTEGELVARGGEDRRATYKPWACRCLQQWARLRATHAWHLADARRHAPATSRRAARDSSQPGLERRQAKDGAGRGSPDASIARRGAGRQADSSGAAGTGPQRSLREAAPDLCCWAAGLRLLRLLRHAQRGGRPRPVSPDVGPKAQHLQRSQAGSGTSAAAERWPLQATHAAACGAAGRPALRPAAAAASGVLPVPGRAARS